MWNYATYSNTIIHFLQSMKWLNTNVIFKGIRSAHKYTNLATPVWKELEKYKQEAETASVAAQRKLVVLIIVWDGSSV